jgi:hypothetical protein
MTNPFESKTTIDLPEGTTTIYRLGALAEQGLVEPDRLPFSIRVLLENWVVTPRRSIRWCRQIS